MNPVTETRLEPEAAEMIKALGCGDLDRAEAILESYGKSIPQAMLEPGADLCVRRCRWREARRLLNRVLEPGVTAQRFKVYIQNMLAMEECRPDLYDALVSVEGVSPYGIQYTQDGYPTIVCEYGDDKRMALSANGHPIRGLEAVMASLAEHLEEGTPFVLLGLGDGYLVNHLAANPPKLFLTQQHSVYVFEPDLHLVHAALKIHDVSGANGPIRQERIVWYVGDDCFERFTESFRADRMLHAPFKVRVSQIHPRGSLGEPFDLALQQAFEGVKSIYDEISAYYAGLPKDHFIDVFRGELGRKPRVLLPTSRFTTVLQNVTRDLAEVFESLGWEVFTLVEPTDMHRISALSLKHAVNTFRPDLVLHIDHLRYEYPDTYPENLPVVCWVQDHLSNLTDTAAGPSIGPRDFVLAEGLGLVNLYDYPARQRVFMGKVTRDLPWVETDGDQGGVGEEVPDITFVSNCSRRAEDLVPELLEHYPPLMQPMIRSCCERLVEAYADGSAICQLPDLIDIVKREAQAHQLDMGREETLLLAARSLWHPLNDTLYRQQALRWAVRAADRLGVTLGLYGNGWEDHPEFARYARGYVRYGAELERLARRSRVNLHIVPFGCIHQRFLDGVMAGGFFLVRDHPKNHPAYDLIDFVERNCPPDTTNYTQACEVLDAERRTELDRLIENHRRVFYGGDVVERVMANRGQSPEGPAPRYNEVCFRDGGEFGRLLEHFLEAEDQKRDIVAEQRAFVREHFTYEAHMKRVLDRIAGLIDTEDQ